MLQDLIAHFPVLPVQKEAEVSVEEEGGDINHRSSNSCPLYPELCCQAAKTNCRADYEVGESFHNAELDEIHTGANKKETVELADLSPVLHLIQ